MGGTVAGQQTHFCEQTAPHQPGCEHFADGGMIEANNEITTNPELSLDNAIISHGLAHLLTKTGHSKSEDPMRAAHDHIDHIRRGRKELEHHSKNIFETKKEHQIKSDPEQVKELKSHLEDFQINPHKLLELGGSLNDSMPDHQGALGAKMAAIMNHMHLIKPSPRQMDPMSAPIPPTKIEEAKYHRQLALMQNPMLAYQGVKDGMINPDDMQTLGAVYPKLLDKMKTQTMGALVDSRMQEKPVSYKHKMGLGTLLGQPLDYTQTPAAAQAIVMANGGAQAPSQQQKGKEKKSGATAQTQKTIEKTDSLAETKTEESLIEQKTHS